MCARSVIAFLLTLHCFVSLTNRLYVSAGFVIFTSSCHIISPELRRSCTFAMGYQDILTKKWIWSHIDALVALTLAIVFTFLGFFGKLTQDQFSNVALAILALLAFILLRESTARENLRQQIDDLLKNQIKPIPPNQIQQDFEWAMSNTEYWYYKGGTGTYLRAVTIKTLGERSKSTKATIKLRIEILDPKNIDLCDKYGEYRRSVLPASEKDLGSWSTDHVREELYSTVLAACAFKDTYPLLDIELALYSTLSVFRYDVSAEYAIITQEDKRAPALRAEKNTHYFYSFRTELDWSFKQSKKLPLIKVRGKWGNKHDWPTALDMFKQLDIFDESFLSGERGSRIIQKAINAPNPYA